MFAPFSPHCGAGPPPQDKKHLPTHHLTASPSSSLPSLSPSPPSSPSLLNLPKLRPTPNPVIHHNLATAPDATQQLLPVILSGVVQHPTLDIRHGRAGPLSSTHIHNILHGDYEVLQAGPTALSGPGGRPESATRAIARSPAQYGAPASLPSAMALAHAHCALHDLFACDARLAPDSAYYDILAPFVTALTDWPAVVAQPGNATPRVYELLGLPQFSLGGGFALGLRCDAIEITTASGAGGAGRHAPATSIRGVGLLQKMLEEDIVWATSRHGWFPWLFVEPLGMCGNVARAYVHNLGAMRSSLAIYCRLYERARRCQPQASTTRPEATRFAYGLQTCGSMWRVYAMADSGDSFPLSIIWSGCVNEPTDMAQATAILRQIGSEAKTRLSAVRSWLACICGNGTFENSRDTPPTLPLGLPIPPALPDIILGDETKPLKLPPGIPIPRLEQSSPGTCIKTGGTRIPTFHPESAPPFLSRDTCIPPTHATPRESTPDTLRPSAPPFLLPRSASALDIPSARAASPDPHSRTQHQPPRLCATSLLQSTQWPRPASAAAQRSHSHPRLPPFTIYSTQQRRPPLYWPPPPLPQPGGLGHPAPLHQPTPRPVLNPANYNYAWPPLPSRGRPVASSAVWAAAPRQASVTISHPSSRVHSRKTSGVSVADEAADASEGSGEGGKPVHVIFGEA